MGQSHARPAELSEAPRLLWAGVLYVSSSLAGWIILIGLGAIAGRHASWSQVASIGVTMSSVPYMVLWRPASWRGLVATAAAIVAPSAASAALVGLSGIEFAIGIGCTACARPIAVALADGLVRKALMPPSAEDEAKAWLYQRIGELVRAGRTN